MGNVYSKYKIFNFIDKINTLYKNSDGILPPIEIRIKPTNKCLHNCWYCAYRRSGLQLGKDMIENDEIPKYKIIEIMQDIIDMNVKSIVFSGGGDPFYYPYLLDAVKLLSISGVKFAALTNGANLNGDIAYLFSYNGTWLRISIDGYDGKSYSKQRGVDEDEFDKIIKNISDFNKIGGKCRLGISFIINKINYTEIYNFLKLSKDIGVTSVKLSPVIVDNSVKKNNNYHKTIFNRVKEQINNSKLLLEDDRFEIYDAYHELNDKFEKNYKWCPSLQIKPVIGADLNIYSCQDKAYNLDEGLIGSIKDKRFKEFWQNGRDKFFKLDPSIVCNHHCVSNDINKMLIDFLNLNKEHISFI